MSFHQRKLLLINNSFQDSISQVCHPYCVDRTLNKDGFCPILCISQCYQTCYRSLIQELLPPPPPPPPPPSPTSVSYHHHLSKSFGLTLFLIVSLVILATTFLVFFSYTVYKLFRQRRRQQREEEEEEGDGNGDEERGLDFLDGEEDRGDLIDHPIWYIRTQGLQSSVINAITICKYKKSDGLIEGTDCAVCLNEFQEDETLRLLPKCNHAFHIPCIDTWLRSHTNCPMCRAGIVISSSARFQSPSVEEQQTLAREVSSGSSSTRDVENDELQEQVTIEVGDNRCSRDGIQPLRRSVSLDSLSASAMSSAIISGGSSEDKQDLELNGTTRSSTSTNTNTTAAMAMAVSMKRVETNNQSLSKSSACGSSSSSSSSMVMRSLSCSAKVFLSRYSRSNRISVVPLPRSF